MQISLAEGLMSVCNGQDARVICGALANVAAYVILQMDDENRETALRLFATIPHLVALNDQHSEEARS
jgi:hypothetical protein